MKRQVYIAIAESGLRLPVGADLVLHEQADPQAILTDGTRLGQVLADTAGRFNSPLAFPHMDLELEKEVLLHVLRIPEDRRTGYHFDAPPTDEMIRALETTPIYHLNPRLRAHIESVHYVARYTDLIPVGMTIGPFSLMTKLVADPITPIAMAGAGMTAEDDDELAIVERVLELATTFILKSIELQINAGADAIFIAEPAANRVFLSPNQMEDGADIFDRYVMRYNLRIKQALENAGVDLIFHCCGELTDAMLQKFTELDPAILSLGSSRKLWEDAAIVPKRTVLYGNLPSKKFYSDALITVDQVARMGDDLVEKMREAGHPFILGSECDVLSVPGCEATITAKAEAIAHARKCTCGCGVH